ncbi:DUF599 domain-containing protein [Aureimonas jatrophae]|uniref:Uncharacterized membrane protein n=1 Tax=Aureimonas jatrophae TaxID=1166073 RepID=A0A1H0GVM3_9HYPH|nr:DUF599 family protein [Aureimonas jatrophae]SDO10950.1 Uncharacterized membrane protein [Aureimonas jatrophae]
MPFSQLLGSGDLAALTFFLVGWGTYSLIVDRSRWSQGGLSRRMNQQREAWMRTMLLRELRMIDTAIMSGLQQGTGFFASACIFAIGGCFALIGSAERIAAVTTDLPFVGALERGLVEVKLLGLVTIFVYAFFKFGWAYRLFNYCTILIGAVPMRQEAERRPEFAEAALQRALSMNRIAGRNFNAGLRAVFFGLAYLGWFVGPVVLAATTLIVVLTLLRRQFLSDANRSLAVTERDAT